MIYWVRCSVKVLKHALSTLTEGKEDNKGSNINMQRVSGKINATEYIVT